MFHHTVCPYSDQASVYLSEHFFQEPPPPPLIPHLQLKYAISHLAKYPSPKQGNDSVSRVYVLLLSSQTEACLANKQIEILSVGNLPPFVIWIFLNFQLTQIKPGRLKTLNASSVWFFRKCKKPIGFDHLMIKCKFVASLLNNRKTLDQLYTIASLHPERKRNFSQGVISSLITLLCTNLFIFTLPYWAPGLPVNSSRRVIILNTVS